jgi:hypothetical protein
MPVAHAGLPAHGEAAVIAEAVIGAAARRRIDASRALRL